MTTPAEQYRTLVARLESIQEAALVTPGMVQSATDAVTAPTSAGAVLRALLTTGMSVVPEIVAFLMKNKSQLSPNAQGVLQQFDTGDRLKAPSPGQSQPPTATTPGTGQGAGMGQGATIGSMRDPTQTTPGLRGM